MGTMFPDSPEFPDYVPMPSVLLEAVRLDLPPLLITAALLLPVARHDKQVANLGSNRLDSSPPVIFDLPHTHTEMQEPMPPASHFARPAQGTSSGDDLSWL